MLRNTDNSYGLVSILIHWVMALGVLGLFGLGVYMVELTYSDSWYQFAPYLHEGFGVLVALMLVVRIGWRLGNPVPRHEPGLSVLERIGATTAHYAFYLLMLVIVISGYLITTAQGDGLNVFDLMEVPSVVQGIDNLEDYAGKVHKYLAYLIIGLVGVHTAAALKHHFIDKDRTLVRMVRPGE